MKNLQPEHTAADELAQFGYTARQIKELLDERQAVRDEMVAMACDDSIDDFDFDGWDD